MRIEVRYGRHKTNFLKCAACHGKGKISWLGTGRTETCTHCAGSGVANDAPGYCYETGDEIVAIGDVVRVPATWVTDEPQEATVTRLWSYYAGLPTQILEVLERAETSDG